jgi:hypothetical protein
VFADIETVPELLPRETVCGSCHLAHNQHIDCPTCATGV